MIPDEIRELLSDEWVVNQKEQGVISNGPRILRIFQNYVTPEIYKGDEGNVDGVYDNEHEKAFTICLNVLNEIYAGDNAPVVIPEKLTPGCFEGHPGPEAILFAARDTNPKYIKHRKGPYGKELAYVEGHYIDTVLDFAFQYRSSFKTEEIFREGDEVICVGHISVQFSDGIVATESQCGHAKIKYYTEEYQDDGDIKRRRPQIDELGNQIPISIGIAYQAAITNCKKKCATKAFGIAVDVYSGEVK